MDEQSKREVRELRAENRRLKHELHTLKVELELYEGRSAHDRRDQVQSAFDSQAKNENLFSKKRYFSYIWEVIKRTSVFRLYTRLLRLFRRFNLIRITVGILAAVVLALQSGALFVLSASASVISIPFTFLVTYATFLFSTFRVKKDCRAHRVKMKGKKIYVFFPPKKGALCENSYFCGMVTDFSRQENSFCVIVSPYFWNTRGLGGVKGKSYIASRSEGENLLIVRRHYYFTMKKRIFSSFSEKITELY